MSLLIMSGFENIRDDSDLRTQGWLQTTIDLTSNQNVVSGIPSFTGVPGTALALRGPYDSNGTYPLQQGTAANHGLLNTGLLISNLWTIGGFGISMNAKFNSTVQNQIANTLTGLPSVVAYDGAQYYWAVMQTSTATFNAAFSTDLINWTATTAAPPGINAMSSFAVIGSGPTATVIMTSNRTASANGTGTSYTYSYSTNMGASWTVATFTGASANDTLTQAITTGNTTWPLMHSRTDTSSVGGIFVQAAVGNTATALTTPPAVAAPRTLRRAAGNTMVVVRNVTSGVMYVVPSASDPTVPANWTTSTVISAAANGDMDFFNNRWIIATTGGIYTAPNSATSPAIAGPTGAWTNVVSVAAANTTRAIAASPTAVVVVGVDPVNTALGAIWTSVDGITWTKLNRFIQSSTGTGFTNIIWDGTHFVIFGGTNMNIIAKSIDGFVWDPVYYPDMTENPFIAGSGLGFYTGNVNGAGSYTASQGSVGGAIGVIFGPGSAASGARVVACGFPTLSSGANPGFVQESGPSVPTSPLGHAYEIVCKSSSTGSGNFDVTWYIDGVATGPATLGVSLATVAGSVILVNLPRFGNFTAVSDLILYSLDGVVDKGPRGVVNIISGKAASDFSTQWALGGTQPTHAAAAGINSLSNSVANAAANNFVTALNDGSKDVYGVTNALPTNFKILAVQVSGYFAKVGTTTPAASVGIVSGASELDSASAAINSATPVYISQLTENDPATGLPWLTAAALAAKFSITKTG